MKLIAALEETDYLTASTLDDRLVRLYTRTGRYQDAFCKLLYDMKQTQPERFPYESPSVTVFTVLTEGLICISNISGEPNYRVDPSMGFANGGEEDEF